MDYTNDWNTTFKMLFHTKEYWYAFVLSLLGTWNGQPLTMSKACQSERTGSSRTKEKRVLLAVTRGTLIQQKSSSNLRTMHQLASATLEELLIGHFERSLQEPLELTQRLLGGEVNHHTSAETAPAPHLIRWVSQ